MPQKYRIVLMGTPQLASDCFQTIASLPSIEIVGVVTQPDKISGRKKEIIFSPVKQWALKNNYRLWQPSKVSEIYSDLVQSRPDLIFTCAFGQFVPENILDIPPFHSVNFHPSPLPQLRGGAPIHWAILNQMSQTAITIMYMSKKMDQGDIIFQYPLTIDTDETYASLIKKVSLAGQKHLKEDFLKLFDQNITATKQNEEEVTFGYNITASDELINWHKSVQEITAKIRGLYDYPIARTIYQDINIKIHHAKIYQLNDDHQDDQCGKILKIDKQGILVQANNGTILITHLQLPGKKCCEVKQLINGNLIIKTETFFH